MRVAIEGLTPDSFRAHPLHGPDRDWTESNCYVDLWIEVLHALGEDPRASLGFTALLDFEGDQFTFFKPPAEDLDAIHGAWIGELSIYDRLETHIARQIERGRLVLLEVDAFHLPDARGVSYRMEHTKTTIAINSVDPAARRLDYFHNAGYFRLKDEDFEGVFSTVTAASASNDRLFPYAEFVKFGAKQEGQVYIAASDARFQRHLAQAPPLNPIEAFANVVEDQARALGDREPNAFHKYAFNTLRQLGSNFELLADHLEWRAEVGLPRNPDAIGGCREISSASKAFQFQLARAVNRRRWDGLAGLVRGFAPHWDVVIGALRAETGR